MKILSLEHNVGDDGEDCQRYAFLNNLELYEVEGSAVLHEAEPVGRHLTAVFKEGNTP